jgi:hypothetical protein
MRSRWYTLGADESPIPWDYEAESKRGNWIDNSKVWPPLKTTVGDYLVSTVFLGLDHGFYDTPPLLWETMIFIADPEMKKPNEHADFQDRYMSAHDARTGHAYAVKMLSEQVGDTDDPTTSP